MKKPTFLLLLFFIAAHFSACKKESTSLHTYETIRKYKLSYFYDWDTEYIPFKKNATLYANKQTDSCLLILRNKKGDTILSHLDKRIFNITMLKYKVNRGNWLVTKRDFGKTTYDDSLGMINNDQERLSLYEYFTIENKKLKKINLIGKKEFLGKIAAKFKHLKKVKLVALDNNDTYVFKDTLDHQQVLYEIETFYNLEYRNGKYVLDAEFKGCYSQGVFRNGVICRKGGNTFRLGEKIFYGKDNWQYDYRYEVYDQKYYRFTNRIKEGDFMPGNELFKTELLVYDHKDKTTKVIKDFPKDSLFDNYSFNAGRQKNKGKIYFGVDGADHSIDYYYQLDTIHWKLIGLPKPFNDRGIY